MSYRFRYTWSRIFSPKYFYFLLAQCLFRLRLCLEIELPCIHVVPSWIFYCESWHGPNPGDVTLDFVLCGSLSTVFKFFKNFLLVDIWEFFQISTNQHVIFLILFAQSLQYLLLMSLRPRYISRNSNLFAYLGFCPPPRRTLHHLLTLTEAILYNITHTWCNQLEKTTVLSRECIS